MIKNIFHTKYKANKDFTVVMGTYYVIWIDKTRNTSNGENAAVCTKKPIIWFSWFLNIQHSYL